MKLPDDDPWPPARRFGTPPHPHTPTSEGTIAARCTAVSARAPNRDRTIVTPLTARGKRCAAAWLASASACSAVLPRGTSVDELAVDYQNTCVCARGEDMTASFIARVILRYPCRRASGRRWGTPSHPTLNIITRLLCRWERCMKLLLIKVQVYCWCTSWTEGCLDRFLWVLEMIDLSPSCRVLSLSA